MKFNKNSENKPKKLLANNKKIYYLLDLNKICIRIWVINGLKKQWKQQTCVLPTINEYEISNMLRIFWYKRKNSEIPSFAAGREAVLCGRVIQPEGYFYRERVVIGKKKGLHYIIVREQNWMYVVSCLRKENQKNTVSTETVYFEFSARMDVPHVWNAADIWYNKQDLRKSAR